MYLMILIVVLSGRVDQIQELDNYRTWEKCEQQIPAIERKWHLTKQTAWCIPTSRYRH